MAGGFIKSQCCCYCKTVWTGVRREEGGREGGRVGLAGKMPADFSCTSSGSRSGKERES